VSLAAAILAAGVILLILVDGFEAIILPRRVSRRFRPTRLFYRGTWKPWSAIGRRMKPGQGRERFLSIFGPLSMLMLLATWAVGLTIAFGVLHWALETRLQQPDGRASLFTYIYMSGATFTTLGFGDVTPRDALGRTLTILEGGLGFGFLAVVIGYLPVLYQAFSRREARISMLDARAGSPPTGAQMIVRHPPAALDALLREQELWAAELLESHISFPVLSYYRSQHDNQSWLAALAAVLDACALLLSVVDRPEAFQAQLTFAASRHAVVDLALIFNTPPRPDSPGRLPPEDLAALRERLSTAGIPIRQTEASSRRLSELRAMYEPFLHALGDHLLLPAPPMLPVEDKPDNWQTSAWMRRVPGLKHLAAKDEHFD
jgi:hypothetical protein